MRFITFGVIRLTACISIILLGTMFNLEIVKGLSTFLVSPNISIELMDLTEEDEQEKESEKEEKKSSKEKLNLTAAVSERIFSQLTKNLMFQIDHSLYNSIHSEVDVPPPEQFV